MSANRRSRVVSRTRVNLISNHWSRSISGQIQQAPATQQHATLEISVSFLLLSSLARKKASYTRPIPHTIVQNASGANRLGGCGVYRKQPISGGMSRDRRKSHLIFPLLASVQRERDLRVFFPCHPSCWPSLFLLAGLTLSSTPLLAISIVFPAHPLRFTPAKKALFLYLS